MVIDEWMSYEWWINFLRMNERMINGYWRINLTNDEWIIDGEKIWMKEIENWRK